MDFRLDRLLTLVHNLCLQLVILDLFDEKRHATMVTLDDHARRDVWIRRKIDGVFAFWTNAKHISNW